MEEHFSEGEDDNNSNDDFLNASYGGGWQRKNQKNMSEDECTTC